MTSPAVLTPLTEDSLLPFSPAAPLTPVADYHLLLPTGELRLALSHGAHRLDALLGFGARANAKRGFLFVSKVLAKHWPVRPQVMLAIHGELAAQVPAHIPGPVLFIAMAETAVGLGQGVFEAFQRMHPEVPSLFIHSTRYQLPNHTCIEFAESHSHAPRQFLHLPTEPGLLELFLTARTLVLVDDEASTGNTFLNLTNAYRAHNPQLSHLHLAAVANFMGTDTTAQLAARVDLALSLGALIAGDYTFTPGVFTPTAAPAQNFSAQAERGASGCFGRLGVSSALPVPHAMAAQLHASVSVGQKILLLGTGEFMHMAFLLGLALEQLGHDVHVQATTRSPILTWGAVAHSVSFADNYGEGVPNFVYNLAPGQYDQILICHETPANTSLYQLAQTLGGRLIHCTTENTLEEIPVY